MAFQVFAVNFGVGFEPLFHKGAVDFVVVYPVFVAGVVWRVDVDAVYAACVARDEGFEGVEVVAVDDAVVVGGMLGGIGIYCANANGGGYRLVFMRDKRAVGYGEVVGVDVLFAFEV